MIIRFKCVKVFNVTDVYYVDSEDITRWKLQENIFQFNIRKKLFTLMNKLKESCIIYCYITDYPKT